MTRHPAPNGGPEKTGVATAQCRPPWPRAAAGDPMHLSAAPLVAHRHPVITQMHRAEGAGARV